jgi:5,10-methenyltetrahydrofolate synthetase
MEEAHTSGATVLLPVVVAKSAPLIFRVWNPGCAMERDIWNIPFPADGAEMTPEAVISPLLGVDKGCFRLGNGGGYYDRALARLDPPARAIGVGFPRCQMPTIFPMPWEIPSLPGKKMTSSGSPR